MPPVINRKKGTALQHAHCIQQPKSNPWPMDRREIENKETSQKKRNSSRKQKVSTLRNNSTISCTVFNKIERKREREKEGKHLFYKNEYKRQ